MALGRRLDIRTRNGGWMGDEGVPMTCPDCRRADRDCECEPEPEKQNQRVALLVDFLEAREAFLAEYPPMLEDE